MHLSHQYNAAYFSGLVHRIDAPKHTNTTPLTFLAWYRIDAPITPIQSRLLFCVRCIESLPNTPICTPAYCFVCGTGASILYQAHQYSKRLCIFCVWYIESLHLSHTMYNAAYFSGWVHRIDAPIHTKYSAAVFSVLRYRIDAPTRPIQRRLLFWNRYRVDAPKKSHQYNVPLTVLSWYRIDAPITPIQRRSLFWLGTESMHLLHQYNAAYFSGLVKNRCTYHTNTTPLTFLAWYRIDAPNTPIQRRLLFWLGTESMHLSHQYNAAYFSGSVQNRCT